jgi:hypothetical protein
MNQTALLAPVLALVLWTFTIFLVMAFGRLRSMDNPQDAAHTKDLKGAMPAWVERTGDNYNHLFEQPVAFYVVTLSIALINNFDSQDGFKIAEEDLVIRGPGEIMGAQQTGIVPMKYTNLVRDSQYLMETKKVAELICNEEPELANQLIERWISGSIAFADA